MKNYEITKVPGNQPVPKKSKEEAMNDAAELVNSPQGQDADKVKVELDRRKRTVSVEITNEY